MEKEIADGNDIVINDIVKELDDVSQLSEVPEVRDDCATQQDNATVRTYEKAMADLEITDLVSERDVTAAEILEIQKQIEDPKEEVKTQRENRGESVPPNKTQKNEVKKSIFKQKQIQAKQPIQETSKEDFWSSVK